MLGRDTGRADRLLPRLLPDRGLRLLRRADLERVPLWRVPSWLRAQGADELVLLSDDLDAHPKLYRLQALGALPLAPRRLLLDLQGRRQVLSLSRFLLRDLPAWGGGIVACAGALARTAGRIARLRGAARRVPRPATGRKVVYLRTDLWSGVQAGGSVAHTAGVAGGFAAAGADLAFVATFTPGLIDTARHPVFLVPPSRLCNVALEVPYFAHSFRFETRAARVLADRPADLIYQRFDAGNHAGVVLSRRLGVPFVLEYNGSEVWVADHWGRPFRWRRLFAGIEAINLRHADLVVTVSDALRDDLLARGVEADRILVLPNGVDATRYHPTVDGEAVRRRHGLRGRVVIGFIGTFGAWHGAPVLARALRRVLETRPEVRALLVGDGPQRAACESALGPCAGRVVFTGAVPQADGPAHLAAMDILVSPHVPNPDGTRFFGSPTKLFEYMAMGRGIVASRLEQIGDVLEDGRTAILVPPGEAEPLADVLLRLVDEPALREALGAAARRRVVERHTWEALVERLIGTLRVRGLVTWN
jgi:glycosyltransferase involved in cell wall biosynthesis